MLSIQIKKRDTIGKKVKNIRSKGLLPAVLYGPEIENINIQLNLKDFEKIYKKAGESSLISLKLDKDSYSVLVHEVKLDPLKGNPLHVDFYQPILTEEVEASVPLIFEGEALAVKDLGGTLIKEVQEIEVKALPEKLPHEIKVNVSSLKTFEDEIKVKDLNLPEGVKIEKNPDDMIALVTPPEKEEVVEKPAEEEAEKIEKAEEKTASEKEEEEKESASAKASADKEKKMNKLSYYLLFTILIFSALVSPSFIFAEDLELICDLNKIESKCESLSPTECRQLLEKCEQYYRDLSSDIELDLNKTGQEKKTLENTIGSLNKKIRNLNYQISQSNLIIKDLGYQIQDTEFSVEKTSLKIEESKVKLANILRNIYEEDQKPIIEIFFAEENLSGFFDNLVSLEVLNVKSKDLLQNIKILKTNLETQMVSLDEEKGDLENIVEIQTSQKSQSNQTKSEQEYYLRLTEKEYQKYLAEKQEVDQKTAEIRARIFELIGIVKAPTFGEAYEIAKYVESVTGVKPAFLLAVLTQESNIGKNVGQCYLKNSNTGAGVVIKTGRVLSKVMKPTRDVGPFLTITGEIGRDPYETPVSCPMSYGWGGAMGPAQFIPSTWIIYRNRLKTITGRPGDPWDIRDAFMAAALYLSDYGAKKQTYDGEFNAALSYFAGPSWYKSSYANVYRRDYGYPVMAITKRYESDIEKIK